ncbi:putative reverse transcriptase domain-containing protein [Tanacetum coccineum]
MEGNLGINRGPLPRSREKYSWAEFGRAYRLGGNNENEWICWATTHSCNKCRCLHEGCVLEVWKWSYFVMCWEDQDISGRIVLDGIRTVETSQKNRMETRLEPGLEMFSRRQFQRQHLGLAFNGHYEFVIVFIDDIISTPKAERSMKDILKLILYVLKKEENYTQVSKCVFGCQGLAGYYRRFIEGFSKIARPMTKLTQKSVKFKWGEKAEAAFQLLKKKLCSAPILALPEGSENFVVYCDASHKGLGAVLMQREKVIAYASRQLKVHEKNISPTRPSVVQ